MISKILKLFIIEKPLERGHVYHMKDHQGWGNAIRWTDWPKMKVHGHLYRLPKVGDVLVSEFTSGAVHEFQFTSVEYCRNPSDMFFAEVKHLGEIKCS